MDNITNLINTSHRIELMSDIQYASNDYWINYYYDHSDIGAWQGQFEDDGEWINGEWIDSLTDGNDSYKDIDNAYGWLSKMIENK